MNSYSPTRSARGLAAFALAATTACTLAVAPAQAYSSEASFLSGLDAMGIVYPSEGVALSVAYNACAQLRSGVATMYVEDQVKMAIDGWWNPATNPRLHDEEHKRFRYTQPGDYQVHFQAYYLVNSAKMSVCLM